MASLLSSGAGQPKGDPVLLGKVVAEVVGRPVEIVDHEVESAIAARKFGPGTRRHSANCRCRLPTADFLLEIFAPAGRFDARARRPGR